MPKTLYRHTTAQEAAIYAIVWVGLFAAPVASFWLTSGISEENHFSLNHFYPHWQALVVLLIAFLIHNFLLAPLLLDDHNKRAYVIGVITLTALFIAFEILFFHANHPPGPPPDRPELPPNIIPKSPPPPNDNGIFGMLHITHLALLVFTLAANLGLKIYIRSKDEHERLLRLQHESLDQELKYLKYQVNPHFLMNTLNNIHAQVDIDAECAKSSIRELSRLMRYILYEGAKQRVPLTTSIEFLHSYIALMRLRYSDKVDIRFDVPQNVRPDSQLPPLLMVPFVENAFKHGVSYQQPSFIHITLAVEQDRLIFTCINSKHAIVADKHHEHGGIGIPNVIKRLELIYGADNYTLTTDERNDTYNVVLTIPIEYSTTQ